MIMRIDVLLVEGGREKNSKGGTDLASVLSRDLKVARAWLDEHGWWWMIDGENNRRITIMANRIVEIDQTELVIGAGWEMGVGVEKVWPLVGCFNMSGMGLKASLEMAGAELIGTGSVMTWICYEKSMSKKVFADCVFDNKIDRVISAQEWEKNHLQIEDEVGNNSKFPLFLEYGGKREKVSIFENFSNMVFRVFESGVSSINILEAGGVLKSYLISFVGRKNYLPSKLCSINFEGTIELAGDGTLERELQNFVIDFVGKYDVKDYGIFYIDLYHDGWKINKIDLNPDVSLDGHLANIWKKSGFNYHSLIKKIWSDAQ
jgi:hypothetical protein